MKYTFEHFNEKVHAAMGSTVRLGEVFANPADFTPSHKIILVGSDGTETETPVMWKPKLIQDMNKLGNYNEELFSIYLEMLQAWVNQNEKQ